MDDPNFVPQPRPGTGGEQQDLEPPPALETAGLADASPDGSLREALEASPNLEAWASPPAYAPRSCDTQIIYDPTTCCDSDWDDYYYNVEAASEWHDAWIGAIHDELNACTQHPDSQKCALSQEITNDYNSYYHQASADADASWDELWNDMCLG